MSFRKASLVALAVTFVVGLAFLYMSLNLPMTAPGGLGIGSGYYPCMLSAAMVISSAAAFVSSWRKKDDEVVIISIPHFGRFALVIGCALLVALVWQLTRKYYLIAIPVELLLLWVLNPEKASVRKAGKTLLIGAILSGAIYGIFTAVLGLKL